MQIHILLSAQVSLEVATKGSFRGKKIQDLFFSKFPTFLKLKWSSATKKI